MASEVLEGWVGNGAEQQSACKKVKDGSIYHKDLTVENWLMAVCRMERVHLVCSFFLERTCLVAKNELHIQENLLGC